MIEEVRSGPGQDEKRKDMEIRLVNTLLQRLQHAKSWECEVQHPTEKVVDPKTGMIYHRRLPITEFSIKLYHP